MKTLSLILLCTTLGLFSCNTEQKLYIATSADELSFTWDNANIYFLLTDRFNNGDPGNDINFERTEHTAVNRGFQGGDFAGITQKIEEGYFNKLGISAIWMTPFCEQIHGLVDEGTGNTYGYHGYWAKDWTAVDPNFGTMEELEELIKKAHEHGLRVVMDVVVNHTGPLTGLDPYWGDDWVRTEPKCTYKDYESTVTCTLVDNLPDIKTEKETDVNLPPQLIEKWKEEGRLEKELAELDAFFEKTGYPRAPKYYIIKWLTDYVRKFGIDGYRIDTAKHTEEGVWAILRKEADRAFAEWKSSHPGIFPETDHFYMVGEVYNYNIANGRWFNYGDTLVDFYAEGIDHLINFGLKYDAVKNYPELCSRYSDILQGQLSGKGVLNYLASHDDGSPFDRTREKPLEAATTLLLSPGACQVYYGDESSRLLIAEGAAGDANLRNFMNWEEIETNTVVSGFHVQDVLNHYQKLGKFRQQHPAVGAGIHQLISSDPFIFKRTYQNNEVQDVVVIGLDLAPGKKAIELKDIFENGTVLTDSYSGQKTTVKDGFAEIDSDASIMLLGLF